MSKSIRKFIAAAASLTVAAGSNSALFTSVNADAAYGVGGNGTAIMEYLDRGVYAIKSGDGMFISWRFNSDDADDAEFRLYRDDTLIYTSKSGDPTNYWDSTGNAYSKYRVDTIENGNVVLSSECKFTSGTNYFDIPLDVPSGGVINGEAYSYSPNDCCAGDVDGDGQYEIIVKWDPSNSKDNSQVTDSKKGIQGHTGKVYIDCYTLDGRKLWRIDMGQNVRAGQHYTQMCVADFDCDGKAELITKTCDGTVDGTGQVIGNGSANYVDGAGTVLTGPEYLSLFEGATGRVLDTIDFPVSRGDATSNAAKSTWGDNYGNRCERMNAAIAYLDGVHPSAVYGRGYYTRLTLSAVDVVNGKLSKRWVYDTGFNSNDPGYGCGNHNVMVADFDNDGKQEVCMGSSCIDDNGKLLWSTQQGHGDAMHVGDLDPDNEGIEAFICHESGNYGVSMVDGKTGRILWHKDGDKDTGRCAADNVYAGSRGAECWGSRPAYTMMDCKGEAIGNKTPAMNFFIYWDGDLEREILDGNTISKMTGVNQFADIFKGTGTSSNNDTKAVPCLTADLFGDWREELVLRTDDNSKLRIWCTNTETKVRLTTLMHDMQYRMQAGCEQSSYNQPPHVSYYLGSDTPLPERPNIKLNGSAERTVIPVEPPTEAPPVDGNLIKNLIVNDDATRADWSISSSTSTGGSIFGDRDFTYTALPEIINGAEAIKTACNSKNSTGDLGQFTAGDEIDVYILLDQRVEAANSIPDWIRSWNKTGLTAESSNGVVFDLYKKSFSKDDTVLLGTNGMNGNVINYTVFVTPKAADIPEPTEVPATEPVTEAPTEEPTTEPPTEEPTEEPTVPAAEIVYGDATCDGEVSLADALYILQNIANSTKYPMTEEGARNADCYNPGDGITPMDALSIQRLDSKVITGLPELP